MSNKEVNPDNMWGEILDKPVFILTSDQDWAPEWAMEIFLDKCKYYNIPTHLFITNQSDVVDRFKSETKLISFGIHPNFLQGSSHGSNYNEIIDHCKELVPDANNFRCHAFFENSIILNELYARGFRIDSNICLFHQPEIVPLFHVSGMLRFPVFFEDDSFYNRFGPELNLNPLKSSLFSPGLKILNFHPLFAACNIPTKDYYLSIKESAFNGDLCDKNIIYKGRGTMTVFDELIKTILEAGYSFVSFTKYSEKILKKVNDANYRFLYKRW
ncbi:hypothetical protein K9N50_00800 [bacterium]|nr:hypothetical protein [bacterium]